MTQLAILVLADGTTFEGTAIGAVGESVGEVVFNTSMTGYQEILTDPSYAEQMVTLTYPHIGNTGVNDEDAESAQIWAKGLIIRDLPLLASNFRQQQNLSQYLTERGVLAIADIDTRKLTRILRDRGAQSGCLMAGQNIDPDRALALARGFPGLKGMDLARQVTTPTVYEWTRGNWALGRGYGELAAAAGPHVVVFDFGVKRNILQMLVARGCRVTVMPATTEAADVLAVNPDGVLLSNGPGDPEPCDYAIDAIQTLLERDIPIFGICLGHQLLGLASGAKTEKMKFGHHGANHPVTDLLTKKVMITSQNHGFALSVTNLPEHLQVTHTSLFDGSIQGIRRTDKRAFGFQGHPEASPGPHDVAPLFDQFIQCMRTRT